MARGASLDGGLEREANLLRLAERLEQERVDARIAPEGEQAFDRGNIPAVGLHMFGGHGWLRQG